MAEIKLVFKPDYSEVNKAIDAIKKDISNSLGHIKISIDTGSAQATQSLAANLQKATSSAEALSSAMGKVTKQSTTFGAGGAISRVTEYTNALGKVTRVLENVGEESTTVTKTVTNNIQAQEKAAQKQAEEFAKLKRWVFEQYRKWDEEDAKEAEEKRRKELEAERKSTEEKNKLKLQMSRFNREQDEKDAAEAEKAAQKQAEAIAKTEQASVGLERQYSNLIRQIQNLKAQYPEGTFDGIEQQAREARDELRNLDHTSENYVRRVKELRGTYQGLQRDMANTRQETQKLDVITESFWMNIQKFARWYIGGNFVVRIVHSLRDALETMKAVDTELANIQKVTDRTTEQMQKTADAAYSVASAYGVAAQDYLESVAEFAKAGFGDQSEKLAEIATKTQLVGDVNSSTANKFLIASNAAWKMNGSIEELNKTLDAANIIENNYATSIEKLAQGMPIAASIAAQAGMTFEETIAALGTITSVTQETGTKAATALRALILNIIGAVGEYEDGIEVTEESVKSLDGILQIYAGDALKAAKAAGTVINPMEAIAALAKASEEGLVNQAELFEVLSGLGGKLRTNQLTALVQNYGTYLEMLDKTTESAGSADKEISVMLDTWEAKTNILKNTWTEFVAKTIDTDIIKWILDASSAVLKFADNAGLAAAAILGMVTVFKGKEIVGGVEDAIKAFKNLGSTLAGLSGGFSAVTTWIGLAATAISAAIMIYKRWEKSRVEAMEAAEKEAVIYKDSLKIYDDTLGKIEAETTDRKELLDAISKINSEYDTEAAKLKNTNQLRKDAIDLLGKEAKANAQAYVDQNTASYLKAKSVLGREGAQLLAAQSAVSSYTAQYQREGSLGWFDNWNLQQNQKKVEELTATVENARAVVETYETALSVLNGTYEAVSESAKQTGESTNNLTDSQKNGQSAAKSLEEQLKHLSAVLDSYDGAIEKTVSAVNDFGDGSYQLYTAMKDLEAAIPGSTSKLYDFENASLLVDAALFEDKESVLDLIDAMRQVDFSEAINEAYRAADAAWDMAEAWTAALPMMGGVFANAAMASSAYAGSLQTQRRDWNARVSSLRQRADYRPKDTGGTGSSRTTASDPELERLKNIISLRKAELAFLEAKGASEDEIIAKNKEIQAALHDQAEYMRGILATMNDTNSSEAERKALEADILALSTEWWKIQNDIASAQEKSKKAAEEQLKLQQEMFDQLKSIVDTYYDKIVSDKEKELSLEEKILAVQQAQAALANAQAERNVRVFNAATGQWEWQANAKNVKSAQDALKKAQDDLNKYQRDQAWKEFKSAWEYVAEQIKSGAMTFKEAYDYMYAAMKGLQDKYGVDLSLTLEDSIGGFKNLNYGIDGLTQEVADSLGNSVGIFNERLNDYVTAVDALKQAMDDAAEKVKNGEYTIEDAYAYLRERAKEISDRYGIDMTEALDQAIAGMDKTNMSIEDLWKSVVLNLMKANSARWFDASDEDKKLLHAQNEYLGSLIGATYDPSGFWSLNGEHLYDPQAEKTKKTSKSSGKDSSSVWKSFAKAAAKNPDAVNWDAMREAHNEYGAGVLDDWLNNGGTYDQGGVLKGLGGIKRTGRDELILPPDLTRKMLDPVNNDLSRMGLETVRNLFGMVDLLPQPIVREETNNSGDSYTINGVTIGEQQAKVTTVYELARLARAL